MSPRYAAIGLVSVLVLAGCGGDGGGSSDSGGAAVLSFGAVTAVGSVVVNGIRFEDTAADIAGDDTPKAPADIRKIGVMLRVRGRLNAGGISGIADRIEIENEIRGPIASITPPDRLEVLGQAVIVDGATVFDGTTGPGGTDPLAVADIVEVHGARNGAGEIRATRIERQAPTGVDELRGFITAKTGGGAGTVTLGGAVFDYDAATVVTPSGAAFEAGTLVEVHLSGTLITRLEVEDLDESGFGLSDGLEARLEGFVSGFLGLAQPFLVAGQAVDASSARFEGGVAADLADDVKVEAEGRMSGGVLVARKIEFKDSIRIQSVVSAGAVAAGSPGSFTLLQRTIFITSATENDHGAVGVGDSLEIRGHLNTDGATITATRIETVGPIDFDKHFVQGHVASKDAAGRHLTILGFDVNAAGAGVEFQDRNELPMTASAFFDAVATGRTVVKARGTPGTNSLMADELELE